MKVVVVDALDPAHTRKARDFCDACPGYSYLQDVSWPDVMQSCGEGYTYLHALVLDDLGNILCYGVLRHRPIAAGYALAAFRRGPLTANPEDLQRALPVLLSALKKRGYISVSLHPRWEDELATKAEAILLGLRGRIAPPGRQTLHSRTGLIDLSPPTDVIVADCNAHARRNLRKIDRLNLSIRAAENKDIQVLENWCQSFARNKGLNIKGLPSLSAQRRWIAQKGGILAIVEIDGTPQGGFSLLRDGNRVFNLSIGWADPDNRLPRSYVVYWHALRTYGGRSEETGIRWLDTAGRTDPRVNREDPTAEGRERFKSGFPQKLVDLPRVHQVPLRPALFRVFDRLDRLRR